MILHVETFGLFLNFLIAEVSFPYVFFGFPRKQFVDIDGSVGPHPDLKTGGTPPI